MNAKEEYKVRLEMSKMHEEFIERMSNSYDNQYGTATPFLSKE